MKKEYFLQGLTCANCAAKIEAEVGKLENILSASVSAISSTLILNLRERADITAVIERIVHRYEPDVTVIDKEAKKANENTGGESGVREIIQFAIGALIFAGGVISEAAGVDSRSAAALFVVSYVILGGGVILRALRTVMNGQIFDENILMSIATVGAFAIGESAEAVGVMLFYQIGEYFQESAVRKSKKSIADLMDIRPDYANVKVNGSLIRTSPESVNTGDIIVIKPGEKIPLDGAIIEGEGFLDTRSLTGESLPRSVKPGDTVLSGCVNENALLTVRVTKIFGESTAAKIIDLVENASGRKAQTENFITTFSRYYTPAVVTLAALLAAVPPLFMDGAWQEWINRALIFLVISCPCALVISIPLGFFGGIGGAARKGILIKGSNYLEALNNLDIVVFDKTGTLTKGVFEVTEILPSGGYSGARLLETAAHAESYSNHPIALSIKNAYGKAYDEGRVREYAEIAGHGVKVTLDGKNVMAGNSNFMRSAGVIFTERGGAGTKVYIAVDGEYAGCIVISDGIKPDSRSAIQGLKSKGVRKTVMLTGDERNISEKIAGELSIDEVYSQLLPHEKVEKLEIIDASKRRGGKLAFIGDGINDAPVLARADIGIAMGGLGSDAAIEAADIVLMTDEPSKLCGAIDIARFTKRVVWQNIVFALGIKGVILLLGAFGAASMWEAVFADVGVAILAVLNAARVIRMK